MPTEKRARQKAARRAKRAAQARRTKARKWLRNSGITVVAAAVVIGLVILTSHSFGSSPPSKSASKSKSTTTTSGAGGVGAAQASANRLAVADGCPASTAARVNTLSWSAPPAMAIDTSKSYSATVKTTAGTFTVTLDAKTAPTTVNSFVFLAQKGYFHCVIFQRVVKGFVDQTGDPTGTGTGGPGYHIANENVPKSYATGNVAMANSGGTDTNGSQFFVVVPGGATQLDGDLTSGGGYSLFGQVTKGMPVVEKINAQGSATGKPAVTGRILSITVHES